jgi:hypothetical protein
MKGSRNERGVGESTFAMSYVITTGRCTSWCILSFVSIRHVQMPGESYARRVTN